MSHFSEFEVIPAVDVQDGEVVQLVGGERGTGKRYGDPVAAAERWVEAGAETLHLVDLDGAFEGERVNAGAIESVVDAVGGDGADAVGLQLGGGIRAAEGARALLDLGLDRVILGTAAVETPDIVAEIDETHPGSVVVSLDAKDGEVVVSGWTEGTGLDPAEAAARYEELGAGAILFTNVDVEGQLDGIDREAVASVVDAVEIPVIASGGVAAVDDVVALKEAGAAAVVVGTALYEGEFTLREAQDAADEI
ncbi:1-(5-phosphoribosyl)-5-[(5-phosphoribosylamino)methylideneamino]imidazole-4-carboxamide isomerase [Halorubrum ezzemoulense]|jgi:phosphoribosylformimino-5-aminoimidazole carboxamide ribotide isomerase|uniref:1-(5-phosphoribosyl)-5-[(5-phosphoribosylamino)methylideneamino] imidazole-4-carboxamide isomerase n=1 Tax=Halorubrum ezzemoulense TaxID=337243 RepID=A0ABT4Z2E4_HALEZ|nr:1-(5-phosphoribosyl)-5-[(5-phosphoribosylamino)methylideneamino]imidazole-4-carboxamide isomerase [Halorubrum ezzemoulense]MDB2244230.1 1-(5-phosphoribosyl)-5-[(5-phosphoribosylamino)methylideneamino]imidazole-4-carboxamide isomerase [Halorubrum ezzemoulense]MDB2252324.1 1-(5-phosphoribosyl)-5-[(5-phosphoribosylamino)methylideneamino]imidazole-4-carboxamide isomerase [Halorubrum ezzemoulense]MDB2277965.1 1-(5-phosphoribosyl)-5-[(5-phosphoribosylamino)methylideneamino]imidazole-4-carboxamide i